MFTCKRCGYSSSIKGNLKNHFKRKTPCKTLKSNISFETLKMELEGYTPDASVSSVNLINCDENNEITKKFFSNRINKNYNSIAHTLIINHARNS